MSCRIVYVVDGRRVCGRCHEPAPRFTGPIWGDAPICDPCFDWQLAIMRHFFAPLIMLVILGFAALAAFLANVLVPGAAS